MRTGRALCPANIIGNSYASNNQARLPRNFSSNMATQSVSETIFPERTATHRSKNERDGMRQVERGRAKGESRTKPQGFDYQKRICF
jgi:hypothetical protein